MPGEAPAPRGRPGACVDPALATYPNISIGGYTPLGTWESGDGFFTTDPARHGLECYFGAVFVRTAPGRPPDAVVQ